MALLGVIMFLFAGCSKEEIEDVPEEDLSAQEKTISLLKSNEFLSTNFLPTFTNYYGRDASTSIYRTASLASEWVHEYDEQGKLVKSSFFELYPYRILKEINYLALEDHKLKYEITSYDYYVIEHSLTETFELTLDDQMYITKIGGDEFIELNEQGWVTLIHAVASNGSVVYSTGYEYDEQGKVLKYLSYDISGTHYATVDYTYNETGDPLSYHFQNIYGAEIQVDYFYREDKTLERLEEESYTDEEDFGTKIFTFTPEEKFSTLTTKTGDGVKKVQTFTGDEYIVEIFENEVLGEVAIYKMKDSRYLIFKHKEYLNGRLHKIEYFDDKGDLDYTEYYDENGELTKTVPA